MKSLLMIFVLTIVTGVRGTLRCGGQINVSIVNENGAVQHLQIEGINLFISYPVGTPLLAKLPSPNKEDYAGQNHVTIDEHRIQLFPAGELGLNHLYLFDLVSKTWETINVYCQPLGVAYVPSRDEISGFCVVNTSIQCVPYFTLALRDGRWTDVSRSGYCSNALSSIDLTNPVILQNYDTDYEANVVKLYFAEQGTNRLHEVNLAEYEANDYILPNYENHNLESSHLVSVNVEDGSFHGLRIESLVDNSLGVYQTLASASGLELKFGNDIINTPSVAFDSYNLDYLVTFATGKTLVIIRQEGTSKQFTLTSTLYDPIQCRNKPIGPDTHHMLCLTTENGALLISISNGEATSQIIPAGNSSIVDMKWLSDNAFYLLDSQNEMSFFLLTPDVLWLGNYAVFSDNIRVVSSSGSISCGNVDSTTKQSNYSRIVVASVGSVIILVIIIGIAVTVSLKCRPRNRFKRYKMVDTASIGSLDSVEQGDELKKEADQSIEVTVELPDNQKDHLSHEASSNDCTDTICMPPPDNQSYRGTSDLRSLLPGSHTFTVNMHTPRQCTSDDSELPPGYRPPPIGSQGN